MIVTVPWSARRRLYLNQLVNDSKRLENQRIISGLDSQAHQLQKSCVNNLVLVKGAATTVDLHLCSIIRIVVFSNAQIVFPITIRSVGRGGQTFDVARPVVGCL